MLCIDSHLRVQCFCSHERIWRSVGSGCKRLTQYIGNKLLVLCRLAHTFSREDLFLPPNPVKPMTKMEN